jgi:hypothetical protein
MCHDDEMSSSCYDDDEVSSSCYHDDEVSSCCLSLLSLSSPRREERDKERDPKAT